MGAYLDQIKAANPDAYQKIVQFGQHQADANQGGNVGDWQAQLITNLDTSQLNAPKTIPWTYSLAPTYNNDPENAYFTGMGQVQHTPSGFTPTMVADEYGSNGQSVGGYTKYLGNINGLPIDANYDTFGNLTGYVPHGTQMNWLDANNYVTSEWDPNGNVKPQAGYHRTGSGGGFIGGFLRDMGPAIGVIGAILAPEFAPAIGEALGASAATSGIVGNAVIKAGLASLQGQDVLASLTSSGISSAVGALTADVPGFNDLSKAEKSIANNAISATLQGKDPTNGILSSAISLGSSAIANDLSTPTQQPEVIPPVEDTQPTEGALPSSTSDFTSGANYGLTGTQPSLKGTVDTSVNNSDPYSVNANYEINPITSSNVDPTTGTGLTMPTSSNLNNMNGGQGLTADVAGGQLSASGFTPTGTIPTPDSSISSPLIKPAVNALLGAAVSGATGTGGSTSSSGTTSSSGSSATNNAAPLSYMDPKLSSDPQYLGSTDSSSQSVNIEPSKLQELHQLYSSLEPSLRDELKARGIQVPETTANVSVPSMPLDSNMTTTKLMATGGSTSSSSDSSVFNPTITKVTPNMLPAAPVVNQPSRLGALRNIFSSVGTQKIAHAAQGGLPTKYTQAAPKGHNPEFITGLTGYYAQGKGTGQSDDIPAMLHDGDYVADADLVAALGDGSSKAGAEALEKFRRQIPHQERAEGGQPVPAKIADGEYVFPASFVTAIGKGDNKAGAKLLDAMREEIRAHKRSAPTSKIPPKAKSPLDYLKMAKG